MGMITGWQGRAGFSRRKWKKLRKKGKTQLALESIRNRREHGSLDRKLSREA